MIDRRPKDLPVRSKVRVIALLTTLLGLLLAMAAMFTSELSARLEAEQEEARQVAALIGAAGERALLGRDTQGLRGLLATLESSRQVLRAVVLTADGREIARYDSPLPAHEALLGHLDTLAHNQALRSTPPGEGGMPGVLRGLFSHPHLGVRDGVAVGRVWSFHDITQRRPGRAAEYRDNETGVHVIRMSHSARLLALAVGVPESQAEVLLNAAPMHDIGKIGIPDRILLKPGRLDPEEWAIMQTHTTIGAEIIGDHPSSHAAHGPHRGPGPPREVGWQRLSKRLGGGGHSPGGAHCYHRGCLRCAHQPAPL